MTKKINPTIGVRLPPAMLDAIDKEIETGTYANRSDWVRCACREYFKNKK